MICIKNRLTINSVNFALFFSFTNISFLTINHRQYVIKYREYWLSIIVTESLLYIVEIRKTKLKNRKKIVIILSSFLKVENTLCLLLIHKVNINRMILTILNILSNKWKDCCKKKQNNKLIKFWIIILSPQIN